MSGGFNNYSYSKNQPQRLELIKKVIKETNADIVSLIDTFRWDEIYTIQELCEMFDYKNAFCINLNDKRLKKLGHNNGITILSNLDNIQFKKISLKTRNCIQSTFTHDKSSIDLFSVYLDDLKDATRLEQIDELKIYLANKSKIIITGDLNSLSHEDITDNKINIDRFFLKNPQYTAFKNQLYEMMNSKITTNLTTFGFKDASIDNLPTAPTKLSVFKSDAFLRLDHCFYKGIKVKKFKVLTDNIFDQVSDHYPILIEI